MDSGDLIAQQALEAVFAQWGRTAFYTPAGGKSRGIKVLFGAPDLMVAPVGIRQRAESTAIEMMVSDVADPKTGDGLQIGDEAFVLSTPMHPDQRRLKWRVELNRA
jgi:hypothetical protein